MKEFIGNSTCLIIEPSASFSASIQSCLVDMGFPFEQVQTIRKFKEAKHIIETKKPKLIVTEYDLDEGLGLALLEIQEKFYSESDRISIVVTKNSSDSAVAEAAEGSIDAFILKPFAIDTFRQKLIDTFNKKINPTEYNKKIQTGREKLILKEFDAAISEFNEAKTLDEKPTIAFFHSGQAYQGKGDIAKALQEFREGRRFQPLHYKCLIGEFEGLMATKSYGEAYALVPTLKANYPISSHRLGQIFTAAVFTFNFDDLPGYYDLYSKMEYRSPRLVSLTSLALLTAGKYWIENQDIDKAVSYFAMGLITKSYEMKFMEMVVDELLKVNATAAANTIFQKSPQSEVGSDIHTRIRFKIDQVLLPPEQIIERGKKLVLAGQASPEIYKTLVAMMSRMGKTTLAESMIAKAVDQYPELREVLYKILQRAS